MIIEKIYVPFDNFKNYIWIPQGPVFKIEDQNSIKIRPVLQLLP